MREYNPGSSVHVIGAVKLEIDWQVKSQAPQEPLDAKSVQSAIKEQLVKHYFTDGQKLLVDYRGIPLVAKVGDIELVGLAGTNFLFLLTSRYCICS